MNLYLDDDSIAAHVVALLRKAGHAVTLPSDVGRAGAHDPVHLTYAVQHRLVMVTRNYQDYEELHDLVLVAGGSHPGILMIRADRQQKHRMKSHEIAAALGRLEAAGLATKDQIITLNQWK